MSEKRKAILDTIVRRYGFEYSRTIHLFRVAEEYEDTEKDNAILETAINNLMYNTIRFAI